MLDRDLIAPREVHEALAWLDTGSVGSSSEYRKYVSRESPIRFACVYFLDYLTDPITGRASLSKFHCDMARDAHRWLRAGPGRRSIWVAPREGGKSVWRHLILPAWALAFGHKRFFLAFSNTEAQAKGHLANLRHELATNERLMGDFPELAPVRRSGSSNTTSEVVTASGAMFAARGIDSGSLGIRRGSTRPDLMLGDDLEPDESNYSPEAKEKRLSTLLNAVLPMNSRASVDLCGTTTMWGSIIHDAVRHSIGEQRSPWIDDHGFRVRYYPAIVERADGSRASMWPAKWSLAELERDEPTSLFQTNMMNLPVLDKADAWWSDDLFVRETVEVVDRIMHVDVAVTTGARSDFSAVVIGGLDVCRRRAVLEYARQFKCKPDELVGRIHDLCRENAIADCFVEVNAGGDLWEQMLSPMPRGTRLHCYRVHDPKPVRIKQLLHHYERGEVVHARRHKTLEDQQRGYPAWATHDDLVDSAAGAVRKLFERVVKPR